MSRPEPEWGLFPCDEHRAILSLDFPLERARALVNECPDCEERSV